MATVDGEPMLFSMNIFPGQEDNTALMHQLICDGETYMLVYSISDRQAFTAMRRYRERILAAKEPGAPMVLVGSKCDLDKTSPGDREVFPEEGAALAREFGCEFMETSAKDGTNVEEAFHEAARAWNRRRAELEEERVRAMEKAEAEARRRGTGWRRAALKNRLSRLFGSRSGSGSGSSGPEE